MTEMKHCSFLELNLFLEHLRRRTGSDFGHRTVGLTAGGNSPDYTARALLPYYVPCALINQTAVPSPRISFSFRIRPSPLSRRR